MRVLVGGGTINDDLQCGAQRTLGRVGDESIVVMNSCKDGLPLQHWVCVCLPGLRFFHVDARDFGLYTTLRPSGDGRRAAKELRQLMAEQLGAGGFADANALWAYAVHKDLPRRVESSACMRLGLSPITGMPEVSS